MTGAFAKEPSRRSLPVEGADLSLLDAPGVRVERVRDAEALRTWAGTFWAGHRLAAFAADSWVEATEAVGGEAAPWSLYLARLEGEPAGVSLAFPAAGVLGLLGIATVPRARRRGAGAAVTLAPVADAAGAGLRAAVLCSTPEGYPLYRRLGFADLGSSLDRLLWRPQG